MGKYPETIEVLYALKDRSGSYSKLVGTSICSMLERTGEKVRVHIFHDGSISEENKEKFGQIAEKYRQEILFYNVRKLLAEVWEEAYRILPQAITDSRYTEATLYRLLAPQVLPEVERLIYLDADTVVNIDIRSLWQEHIGPSGMAAVREVDLIEYLGLQLKRVVYAKTLDDMAVNGVTREGYFNAGVLLMDLARMRKMGNLLIEGFKMLTKISSETNFYDQNILNYFFAKDLTPLPCQYNLLQYWDNMRPDSEVKEGIYHFSSRSLGLDPSDERNVLHWEAFLKTPWADGRFFCRFNHELKLMYQNAGTARFEKMRSMLAAWGNKRLVIAYEDKFKEKLDKLFPPDACYCHLGSKESLNLHFDYDVDSHFYLLFVSDYPKVNAVCAKAGLQEGEHYLDGGMFLEDKLWANDLITIQQFYENL